MLKADKAIVNKGSNGLLFVTALVTALLLLQACKCYRRTVGKKADKTTNQPIDSVFAELIQDQLKGYTETTGNFDVCEQFGSCVPYCKDIVVSFFKQGINQSLRKTPTAIL